VVTPYYVFNNRNSKEFNIHIAKLPPIHTVDDEGEYIEIPGRDGYLFVSSDRRKPIEKLIESTIFPDDYIEQIKRWLKDSGKLILSNESDVYFNARIQSVREYWGLDKEKLLVTTFICQPWAYLHTGDNLIIITTKDTKIYNPEEVSKPLIKIFGSGTVDLIINNKIHKFNIDEYVTIDSELMESYKDTSPATFIGDFPELIPGENNITWDGTVTKIEVIPRWRR